MSVCKKCNEEAYYAKFCPSCGTEMYSQEQAPSNEGAHEKSDVEQNKAVAIIAYLGILCIVPILAAPNSTFARYHANQGLILFIVEVGYGVAYATLSGILVAISWNFFLITSLVNIVAVLFLALTIVGIVNAAGGKMKELPVIGKFRILK